MSFISKSITGRQFLLNKSFTYFWVIYHIVKLQNCSSLDGRVIATKISKYLLSLKVLQIGNSSKYVLTYFGLIYCIIKLQNCSSLDGRVIATKVSKCLLSLKVLQSNIKLVVTSTCASISQENLYSTIFSTSNLYGGR